MIHQYDHKKHFEMLKSWNDSRGQCGLEEWMLPKLGFVLEGQAIAFLVTTNSPVAWIAHWTINPTIKGLDNREVIFMTLSRHIEKEAQHMGFKLIQTLARVNRGLLTTLKKRGFIATEDLYTFLVKDIRS